jgi:S1-C subfamily serine protease
LSFPAARTNLKQGDVIVSVDGMQVSDAQAIIKASNKVDLGATMRLKVLRNDREIELDVTLDGM